MNAHLPGLKRTARFEPKNRDTLRPEVVQFIGQVFEWHCVGTGGPDEAFAGQARWQVMEGPMYWWVPDEDLAECLDGEELV